MLPSVLQPNHRHDHRPVPHELLTTASGNRHEPDTPAKEYCFAPYSMHCNAGITTIKQAQTYHTKTQHRKNIITAIHPTKALKHTFILLYVSEYQTLCMEINTKHKAFYTKNRNKYFLNKNTLIFAFYHIICTFVTNLT